MNMRTWPLSLYLAMIAFICLLTKFVYFVRYMYIKIISSPVGGDFTKV